MAKKRSWFDDKERRAGKPRTEKERKKRHRSIFGEKSKLPPRGTGLKRR